MTDKLTIIYWFCEPIFLKFHYRQYQNGVDMSMDLNCSVLSSIISKKLFITYVFNFKHLAKTTHLHSYLSLFLCRQCPSSHDHAGYTENSKLKWSQQMHDFILFIDWLIGLCIYLFILDPLSDMQVYNSCKWQYGVWPCCIEMYTVMYMCTSASPIGAGLKPCS